MTDLYEYSAPAGADENAMVDAVLSAADQTSVQGQCISGAPWSKSAGRSLKFLIKGSYDNCTLFYTARPANLKHIHRW